MTLLFKIVNVFAFLILIAVNFYSSAGRKIGSVSNSIDYLFRPAGYAFSIWGAIYLLLLVWIIRQFIGIPKDMDLYVRITPWFLLNIFFNILWIQFFANEKINASLAAMIGVLITLMIIYSIIIHDSSHSPFFRIPFSMYLGWISVATIVNVFVFFKFNHISSFLGINEYQWTILLLIIGGCIGFTFMLINHDLIFPLVIVWAYIAIIVSQWSNKGIVYTSGCMVLFLLLGVGYMMLKSLSKV